MPWAFEVFYFLLSNGFSFNTLLLGPFTALVKRSLTITNHNSQPVAFKVKTTAPKVRFLSTVFSRLVTYIQLYCVRPNSGRVEPWETVEVSGV